MHRTLPQVEADLAASLFLELRTFLAEREKGKTPEQAARPMSVGVITPYKQQVSVLRNTFRKLLGDTAAEVSRDPGYRALDHHALQVSGLRAVEHLP